MAFEKRVFVAVAVLSVVVEIVLEVGTYLQFFYLVFLSETF